MTPHLIGFRIAPERAMRLLITAACFALLAACGQAGPLVLPDDHAAAPPPPPAPVESPNPAPQDPVTDDDDKNKKTP
jgi:predicted small lipoprotein YifL